MKTRKSVVTLAMVSSLWMAALLGCSYLRSGPSSSSSSSGGANSSRDYFPLPVGAKWKYRSTTGEGKQSEFTINVLKEESEGGNTLSLVETVSTFQPIHDWYSKPSGWVVMHREEYVKAGTKADFQPPRQLLKNPLTNGDTWSWKGKGMMGLDVDESSQASGPETVSVPAGTFEAMKVTSKVVQGGASVSKTYWYAPGVGLVKSITDTGAVKSSTELLEYSGVK